MGWWRRAVRVSMVAVVWLGEVAWAQAPRYLPRALDHQGQCNRLGIGGLDEQGRAVGWRLGGCGSAGELRSWGAGPLALPSGYQGGEAHDISEGRVAGSVHRWIDGEAQGTTPVVWEGGQPRVLPLPTGWSAGYGKAINVTGDIAGWLHGPERMVLWHADGTISYVGTAFGELWALNGRRQVVGCGASTATGPRTPWVWEGGRLTTLPPSNWNDQRGCAHAVNESGVIAGISGGRPVLWRNGAVHRLAPPIAQGAAVDVNDAGKVVGDYNGRFFYSNGTDLWDLDALIEHEGQPRAVHSVFRIANDDRILAQLWPPAEVEERWPEVVLLTPIVPGGPDPIRPNIALTSPHANATVSDLVTLKASASDNVGVVGVQFLVNGQPAGVEDTTAPYAHDLELTDRSGAYFFHARARDAAGNVTDSPVRFFTNTSTCQELAVGQTRHGSIGTRTAAFTALWTGMPQAAPLEGGLGLSKGTPGGFSGTSAAVLFAADGEIKVRNGGAYQATGVRYSAGVAHHFRMAVDVAAARYSVWLKIANQPERSLATNAQFRGGAVTQLDHWMARVDETSPGAPLVICNVTGK